MSTASESHSNGCFIIKPLVAGVLPVIIATGFFGKDFFCLLLTVVLMSVVNVS